MSRRSLPYCLIASAALVATSMALHCLAGTSAASGQTGAHKTKPAAATSGKSAGALPVKTAYDGPPVIDPSNYYGAASMGYAAAKAAPEVMSKLFCYCGCDVTDKHHYLIDCFTSTHGVDCHICQEEAILGLKLRNQDVPVAEIQKQVDEEYSKHYPFQEETATLKQYKAARLYGNQPSTAAKSGPQGPFPASEDAKNLPGSEKAPKAATAPKVKPGFQVGNCCAEHADKNEKPAKK